MAREDLHFRLRIPPDLKAKIEMAALANRRSMTAEIISRLEGAVIKDADGRVTVQLPLDLLERIDAHAASTGKLLETAIHETLEREFPYVPTFAEYLAGVREEIEIEENVPQRDKQFLLEAEDFLRDNPDLGKRRLDLRLRPYSFRADE